MTDPAIPSLREAVDDALEPQDTFAAVVLTEWHLAGAVSLARDDGLRGTVFVLPHPSAGHLVAASAPRDLELRVVQARLTSAGGLRGLPRALAGLGSRQGADLTLALPRLPHLATVASLAGSADLRRRISRLVLLDEGLGTYLSADYWKRIRREAEATSGGGLSDAKDRLAAWALRRVEPFESRFLFRSERERLVADEAVAASYGRYFAEHRERFGCATAPPPPDGALAVFVSQPLVETNAAEDGPWRAFAQRVARCVREVGLVPVVKPHPRDDPDRVASLDMQVHSGAGMLEVVLQDLEPACALGLTSTALLTAAVLFDVPTISLTRLAREHLPQASYIVDSFPVFETGFADLLTFPADWDELVSALRRIAANRTR